MITAAERAALQAFLAEDLPRGDLTSTIVLDPGGQVRAQLVAQASGVLAGQPYVRALAQLVDRRVRVRWMVREGHRARSQQVVAQLTGTARALCAVERTLLNLLGHMSGVATLTQQYVQRIRGTRTAIYDTRKTHPGLRAFERYAVRTGGGHNHRFSLSDTCFVKTNHVKAMGLSRPAAITAALRYACHACPRATRIVEVTTMTELAVALIGRAHIVLLDNWTVPHIRGAVRLRARLGSRVPLEVSGGVTLRNVRAVASTGVERISVGALTKAAPMLDFALRVRARTGRRG